MSKHKVASLCAITVLSISINFPSTFYNNALSSPSQLAPVSSFQAVQDQRQLTPVAETMDLSLEALKSLPEIAHAEGMPLEDPKPISKNGIGDLGQIKNAVKLNSTAIQVDQHTIHVDNDLLDQYKSLGFKTREAFLKFLNRFFTEQIFLNPPQQKEIALAILDTSETLFEDHFGNGFIGVHRSLFEKLSSVPKTAFSLFKIGVLHELSHEALLMERRVLVDYFQEERRFNFGEASREAERFIQVNRDRLREALTSLGLWDQVERQMLEVDLKRAQREALDVKQIVQHGLLSLNAPLVRRYLTEERSAFSDELKMKIDNMNTRHGFVSEENPVYQEVSKIFNDVLKAAQLEDRDIKLYLVQSDEISAYWIKDSGSFFVHMGLLKTLDKYLREHGETLTKDKVAWILAYEVRHLVQFYEGKDIIPDAKTRDERQVNQNLEYDADLGGLFLAANAGYNPNASVAVLRFLDAIGDTPLVSSHPKADNRIGEVQKILKSPDQFLPHVAKEEEMFSEDFMLDPSFVTTTPSDDLYQKMLAATNLEELMALMETIEDPVLFEEFLVYYYFKLIFFLSTGLAQDPAFKRYLSFVLAANNLGTLFSGMTSSKDRARILYQLDWEIPVIMGPLFLYMTQQSPEGMRDAPVFSLDADPHLSRERIKELFNERLTKEIELLSKSGESDAADKVALLKRLQSNLDSILQAAEARDAQRPTQSRAGTQYRKLDFYQDEEEGRDQLDPQWTLGSYRVPSGKFRFESIDTEEVFENFEVFWGYFVEEYDQDRADLRKEQRGKAESIRMLGLQRWFRQRYGTVKPPEMLFDIEPDDFGNMPAERRREVEAGRAQFLAHYYQFLAFHFLVSNFGAFTSKPSGPPLPEVPHLTAIKRKANQLTRKKFEGLELDDAAIELLSLLNYEALYQGHQPAFDENVDRLIAGLDEDQIVLVLKLLGTTPPHYQTSMPYSINRMLAYDDYLNPLQKKYVSYTFETILKLLQKKGETKGLNLNDLNQVIQFKKELEYRYQFKVDSLEGYQQVLYFLFRELLKGDEKEGLNVLISEVGSFNSSWLNQHFYKYLLKNRLPERDYTQKIEVLLRLFPNPSSIRNKMLEEILSSIPYSKMAGPTKKKFLEKILPLFKTKVSSLQVVPGKEKDLHQRLSLDYMMMLKVQEIPLASMIEQMIKVNAVVAQYDLIVVNQAALEGISFKDTRKIAHLIKGADNGFETYLFVIGSIALAKRGENIPLFLLTDSIAGASYRKHLERETININYYTEAMGEEAYQFYLHHLAKKDNRSGHWLFKGLSFEEAISLVLELLPASKDRDKITIQLLNDYEQEDTVVLEGLTPLESERERPRLDQRGPIANVPFVMAMLGLRKTMGSDDPEVIDIPAILIAIRSLAVPGQDLDEQLREFEIKLNTLKDNFAVIARKRDEKKLGFPDHLGAADTVNEAIVEFVHRNLVDGNPRFDYLHLRDYGYSNDFKFELSWKIYNSLEGYFKDPSVSFEDKLEKLLQLFPDKTFLRDNIIEKQIALEEARLAESNFTVLELKMGNVFFKSYEIVLVDDFNISKLNKNQADRLIEIYKMLIPLMTESYHQIMLGRKAYELQKKFYPELFLDVDSGLSEILNSFPKFSLARDSILGDFINSTAVKTREDLFKVNKYLLEGQRISQEKEIVHLSTKDEFWKFMKKFPSRKERGDFIIWLFSPDSPMPESLQKLSDHHYLNFDSIPSIVFSMTQVERDKLFYDLLRGYNGVFEVDSTNALDEMTDFIERLFTVIFPSGELGEEESLLKGIFVNIFTQYSTERRILLFNSLVNLFATQDAASMTRAKKLRVLLEQMGIVGVKVGQYLSEQPQLLGGAQDIQQELRQLKKDAGSFHKRAIFQLLTESQLLDDVEIGEILGSASIKQVYSLTMKEDGREVAGKFMRPAAEKFLEEDLKVLKVVLDKLRVDHPDLGLPSDMLDEIKNILEEELDFEQEVRNARQFNQNLSERTAIATGDFTIKVPEIIYSSKYVILEEKVKGVTLTDLILLKSNSNLLSAEERSRKEKLEKRLEQNFSLPERVALLNLDVEQIQIVLINEFFLQTFGEGFFHADLHFGNAMVTPNREIYLIDLGAAGELDLAQTQSLLNLLVALEMNDLAKVVALLDPFLTQNLTNDKAAQERIQEIFRTSQSIESKLNELLKVINQLGAKEELVIYLKALSTISPLIDSLSEEEKKRIVSSYLTPGSKLRILIRMVMMKIKGVLTKEWQTLEQDVRPHTLIESSV